VLLGLVWVEWPFHVQAVWVTSHAVTYTTFVCILSDAQESKWVVVAAEYKLLLSVCTCVCEAA